MAFYSFARYKLRRTSCALHLDVKYHQFVQWLPNLNYPRARNISRSFRYNSERKLLSLLVCDADIQVLKVFDLLREADFNAVLVGEHIQGDYLDRRNERDQPFMIVPRTLVIRISKECMLQHIHVLSDSLYR